MSESTLGKAPGESSEETRESQRTPLRILVTGASGFLGKEVLPLLRSFAQVVGISRRPPGAPAEEAAHWLKADLAQWDGGLSESEIAQKLRGKFDVLLHMAALYDLRSSEQESYLQNIAGTHAALSIATKAEIPCFAHVSTVAVTVGDRGADDEAMGYSPDRLQTQRTFPDHYSKTKAKAEELVRNWDHSFQQRLIFRLGVLTGNTRGDAPERMDGPYWAMEAFERMASVLRFMPGKIPVVGDPERSRLPLLPVDVAARAIAGLLSHHQRAENRKKLTSYFVAPPDGGVGAETFYQWILECAGVGHRELTYLKKIPEFFQKQLMQWASGIPKEELEYFLNLPRFDTAATAQVLGQDWCPSFDSYQQALWRGYQAFKSQ